MKKGTLLLCLCLLLSGCAASPETLAEKQVLRYVNYSHLDAIHPRMLVQSAETTVVVNVLEGLMRVYQSEVVYGQADGYEVSADGLIYTFHLREDARYSDGQPVLAADFLRGFQKSVCENYHVDRIGLLKNAAAIYAGAADAAELGVSAPDTHTLCVELEQPTPQFLQVVALPVFTPVRADADAGGALRPEDCNGPFTLMPDKIGDVLRMEKNPLYWDANRIHLDTVEAVYMQDDNVAYQAFAAGNVDVMPQAYDVPERPVGILRQVMTGIRENLYMDLATAGPLQCKELRLALNYALDREAYANRMGADFFKPMIRCVPPSLPGMSKSYVEEYPDTPFPLRGDMRKAKAYLEQAVAALGVSGPADIRFTLTVHNDNWSVKEGETLIRQWQDALGISVSLLREESDQLWTWWARDTGGMVLSGSIAELPDQLSYLEEWSGDYARGTAGCSCDLFNSYLNQAATQMDRQTRMTCLYKAEQVVLGDAPFVPLQLRAEQLLMNKKLRDFKTSDNMAGGGYEFIYAYFDK